MLLFVTATRKSLTEFEESPTGKSLRRISFVKSLQVVVSAENQSGLPTVYNQVITEQFREHHAVFVHDDVWFDDIFIAYNILNGLKNFDVIGVAGNRRLIPDAPAWCFKDDTIQWDSGNLSGLVCHGPGPFGPPSIYGPTPARVELLDGVLLAARISTLLDAGVRFDERFDFHFYDLDFSRQANAAGLSVGTWPVSITHVSPGSMASKSWRRGLKLYREKWQNAEPGAVAGHAADM